MVPILEFKELTRRKIVGGKVCCNFVWNIQVLSPKVASQTDSSSVRILQDGLVSDNGIKVMPVSKFLGPENSEKHGSVTKAIEKLLSLSKISKGQGSSSLMPFQENKKSNLTIPEIINLEDNDESRHKSPMPTVFIDLTVEPVEAKEMNSRTQFVSSQDKSPGIFIDLEAKTKRDIRTIYKKEVRKDEDSENKICTFEVVDSRGTADPAEPNLECAWVTDAACMEKESTEVEDQATADDVTSEVEKAKVHQGYAENLGCGEDNDCHASQIVIHTMEDATGSNQATLTEDQCARVKDDADMEEELAEVEDQATTNDVISAVKYSKVLGVIVEDHVNMENRGNAEHQGNSENNDCHASQIKAYKMEDATGCDQATLTDDQRFT